jgi:hypothetical protein
VSLGKLKMVHVQRIIDKSRSRLTAWQGRLLNLAGRQELVCSVLSAMPIYLLTSIKPPKQLIEDIDQTRRRFLWAGNNEISGGKCKVVGTLYVPADFVVVETGNDERAPIILGRPFLNTSGAVIYASAAKISFYIKGTKETFSIVLRTTSVPVATRLGNGPYGG